MTAPRSVPGFSLGHWTHPSGRTGCTVILAERPALAACDVRGGAPGTRETELMRPGSLVRHVDAVLLTGGSAFGLAAAEGVVRWLHEHGRGFPTEVTPVPIVAAAVLYDLTGPEVLFADASAGYAACAAAIPEGWYSGRLGAGAGATVGKLLGRANASPTGLGSALLRVGAHVIGALAAVNAIGEIVDPATGVTRAGIRSQDGTWLESRRLILSGHSPASELGTNTTLVVVATDHPIDHDALFRMTVAAHDAIARTIRPAHTIYDGDTVFVLASAETNKLDPAEVLRICTATEIVVEQAILASIPQ